VLATSAQSRISDLAPEGVDPGVRDLLEGLVGLLLHDLEPGARDPVGDGAAEFRATDRVAAAGQHERRDGNLGQAVACVVAYEGVDLALQVLGALPVREGEHVLDELGDGPWTWARAV
jgi:hypothetical protein